jgi:hypothetical protein
MRGILLSSITGLLLSLTAQAQPLEMVPIYRFYRPDTVDHLYSNAPAAESPVVSWAYNAEGPAFSVAAKPAPGLIPLYRFFKPTGGHYYDTNPGGGARFNAGMEGVMGYIWPESQPGLNPLFVWYNPNLDRHFYTLDPKGELAPLSGYQPVGILGYVVPVQQ